jgi:hypothetical protein
MKSFPESAVMALSLPPIFCRHILPGLDGTSVFVAPLLTLSCL